MFTVNCQVFDRIKTQLYNFKQNWEIFVQTFWRIFNAVKHKFHPDFSQLCNSKIDSNAAFFESPFSNVSDLCLGAYLF